MPRFKTLDDIEVAGRRVLVRVDFNVPMADGRVTDASRIERAAATVTDLAERGARVILLSHLGRPEGRVVPEQSLAPVAEAVSAALGGRTVSFAADCVGPVATAAVDALGDGDVLLLENLRFHEGEEANDPGFARDLAALGDVYVNDAFSAAHRAHASTAALAGLLPAAAGRLMQAELEHLARALEVPERPVTALVGGAKVSTKLDLLGNLVGRMDVLVVGGAMANTFLEAQGLATGRSLVEREMVATARAIAQEARQTGCELVLPADAVVAPALEAGAEATVVAVRSVPAEQMILDIGPVTVQEVVRRLQSSRTCVWNGPLGAFEVTPFDAGTSQIAAAAAELTRAGRLLTVAGGGDTVAALRRAGALGSLSYVSMAGGAFLEWLEGKTLPGVAALQEAAG